MEPISVFSQLLLGGIATGIVCYTFGADVLAAASKGTVRHGPEGQHAVALTFDDGPDPVFTPRILDILDEFGAHATFFIIGKRAAQHPEIIRSIASAGHELGNHTYGHRPLWLLPPRQTRAQIDRATQVLTTILGRPPRFFRPPWGRLNWAAARHSMRVQQPPVLWSLRPEGWLPLARPETIARHVAQRLHPGAIIDLHDGGGLWHTPAHTVPALQAILELVRERGLRCLTLSELLAEGPTCADGAYLPCGVWDWYEWAWNAWHHVERLGQDTILTLEPAIHSGPDLRLRDGTGIQPGAQVGELHLDRCRVAHLHRTIPPHCLGLGLRRELERTLQQLARMVIEHPRHGEMQAFRSTTLFWKEAGRLGFEACAQDIGWHLWLVSWYQRRILARDRPLGRRRLHRRHWEARTIWLSRQELLRRYS
jgi:peptidoglycan-N-acetylglucosamine deacetylase